MMMGDPKKLAVMMISAKGKPSSSYDSAKDSNSKMDQNGESDSDEEGLKSASEDILSAIKVNDAGALKEALKSFMDLCESYEDEGEDEDQEDSSSES